MEVFLSPNQKMAGDEIFNIHGQQNPQLPWLTERAHGYYLLSYRNDDIKKMICHNPELKRAPWFTHIPNLKDDNVLMMSFLKPVKIDPVQTASRIVQNIHGVVSHLLLKSYTAVKPVEMNILEKRLTEIFISGEERKLITKYGHDISRNFSKIVFFGENHMTSDDLQVAFSELRRNVYSALSSGICTPILQQGPFSQIRGNSSGNILNRICDTQKDHEIPLLHNHQLGDLGTSSSVKDSWVSNSLDARLQSQHCTSPPSDFDGRKGSIGGTAASVPRPQQSEAKEKNTLKHEGAGITNQNLSTCSRIVEKNGRQEVDTRVDRERNGNFASSHGGYPVTSSANMTCPPRLSISQKGPDASLSTQRTRSPTPTKTELFGKEKSLDIFRQAGEVNSYAAKDDDCGIRRKFFASPASVAKTKTVLLLGAKGSGKTCLVNAVANFIMGVENASEKWTVSDEAVKTGGFSSTENITGYTFVIKDKESEDLALTLIDTPGLNDTSGNEVRDHVESLKTFLANAAHKELEIHAIALVVQAHLVRLTSSERLVMDHLKTLFGHDVSGHVVNLITFADNQSKPPVVEALSQYGMSTKHCFKFNNSVFCGPSDENEKELDRVYWKTSHKSWKKCWKVVKDLGPLKTNIMKSIQKEVYATNIRDAAVQELHVEMEYFLRVCKNASSDQINKERRRVWNLANVVFQMQQETDRMHCASLAVLVETKYRECKGRDCGDRRDFYLLMTGFPTTVFRAAIAILEANMKLIQSIQAAALELKHLKEDKIEKIKSFFQSSNEENGALAEKILVSAENKVVQLAYESVVQLVEHHTGVLGQRLSHHSFLRLLEKQVTNDRRWMVVKLLSYELSLTKTRFNVGGHKTKRY